VKESHESERHTEDRHQDVCDTEIEKKEIEGHSTKALRFQDDQNHQEVEEKSGYRQEAVNDIKGNFYGSRKYTRFIVLADDVDSVRFKTTQSRLTFVHGWINSFFQT
jgi:hypothetical protein